MIKVGKTAKIIGSNHQLMLMTAINPSRSLTQQSFANLRFQLSIEKKQSNKPTAGKSNLTSVKTGSNMCEIAREGSC